MTTNHIYLGSMKVASRTTDKLLYYHSDHLGSSNVITNSSGARVQLSEYKPYGELSRNTAKQTNYYFTGKELDSTGLYYYGARYYDARLGRFITADPLQFDDPNLSELTGKTQEEFLANPQNFNRYTYCLNNPLRYIDPTGYYSWDEFNQDYNNLLYNLNQGINWASYNIIQPINNTFYSPGYNYGLWAYGEKNLRSFYGASLDAAYFTISIISPLKSSPTTFYQHYGPLSNPESKWVTRLYTDPKIAMDRLSAPTTWDSFRQVNVPWYKYVAGPRPTAPVWNEAIKAFTTGKGLEYRIGGFGNWGEYLRGWMRYLIYLLKD